MGLPYAIISVLAAGFFILALVLWTIEGWNHKKERNTVIAIMAGFVVAAIALWYVVKALLASEQG